MAEPSRSRATLLAGSLTVVAGAALGLLAGFLLLSPPAPVTPVDPESPAPAAVPVGLDASGDGAAG